MVNVVQRGKLRVDVGERGRAWLTWGRCKLMLYNLVKLG